jgi:hypothetical protein
MNTLKGIPNSCKPQLWRIVEIFQQKNSIGGEQSGLVKLKILVVCNTHD